MSPQFNYRPISITSVLSKVFERQVSVRLRRFMESSLLIGKSWEPVIHFFECPIHCKVHWRLGMRLGSFRLISAQPLIGLTISQGILYKHCCVGIGGSVLSIIGSFHQIDHSMLWWTLVGVNWLTSYQECHREVFWARYCSSGTPRSLFSILGYKLIGCADDGCYAIPWSQSYSSIVPVP